MAVPIIFGCICFVKFFEYSLVSLKERIRHLAACAGQKFSARMKMPRKRTAAYKIFELVSRPNNLHSSSNHI